LREQLGKRDRPARPRNLEESSMGFAKAHRGPRNKRSPRVAKSHTYQLEKKKEGNGTRKTLNKGKAQPVLLREIGGDSLRIKENKKKANVAGGGQTANRNDDKTGRVSAWGSKGGWARVARKRICNLLGGESFGREGGWQKL